MWYKRDMENPFRIGLVERDGAVRCEISGYDGWTEPICPACNEPIQWVLDMASFSTPRNGVYTLMHARCAWTPEAFRKQERASFASS